jgi:predicted GH43/DUF377 family glycosyl hydrolase
MTTRLNVSAIEPVQIVGPDFLSQSGLMSAYVWRDKHQGCSMVFRVVPHGDSITGQIWYAKGDGLSFHADTKPILAPDIDGLDCGGCEDPTLVRVDDGCLVYYTGLRADRTAQLLYATAPDIHSLEKRGVAHASTMADHNTKEATIEHYGGRWLLLFEYSREGRSRIARAIAVGPAGPWRDEIDPFHARADKWDSWHLSTGPLLIDEPNAPLMFYNGANVEGDWAIGWVRLSQSFSGIVERCEHPLISPPTEPGPNGRRIAFASSLVALDDAIWLFFTENDRTLSRATIQLR